MKTQKLRFSYKEQKEFETIDEEIEKLEQAIADKERLIGLNASDFLKLNQLTAEKEELECKLEEKMERWEYLNELNEKIQQQ